MRTADRGFTDLELAAVSRMLGRRGGHRHGNAAET
jgi:hypothetical protein